MNEDFLRSKLKHQTLMIYTDHPEGEEYNGIVLGISGSLLVFQDTSEFELEGISILPLAHIVDVRNGWRERVYDKVLLHHDKLSDLNRDTWIRNLSELRDAIIAIKEKDIWPAIEIMDGDDTLLYMGKITDVNAEDFTIYSYDSLGNWERETKIDYEDIFCIQVFNKYTDRFNSYVKSLLTK